MKTTLQYIAEARQEMLNLQETYSVYKSQSPTSGQSVSSRVTIKVFKTQDEMHKFLSTGDNALFWKETGQQNLKSGTYKLNMVRGKDGKPAREFIKIT